MTFFNTPIRTFAIASALVYATVAAQAATVALKADLQPSSEVPAKTGPGHGALTATVDTDTNELKYQVTYEGLTGPTVAAHFHGPAEVGMNAKPQVPVAKPLDSPIAGKATLTPEQVKELVNGKWYFNIHTAQNPGGEIRGQVTKE